MNRFRKAISVGMSATLLASLFTTIAATAVLAAPATAVTSVGSVPRAGTSTSAGSFSFTEDDVDVDDWQSGTLTVTILDNDGDPTVHFVGTGTLTAPGSLDASLSVGDNSFTVTIEDGDDLNRELFTVSGLKIKADGDAALGAILTTYVGTGDFEDYFDSALKATGTLANTIFATATSALVNVTSVCPFVVSGANVIFTSPTDSKAASAVTAVVGGQQTLTVAATTAGHAAGTSVSQVLAACVASAGTLASAGTVVDSLKLSVATGPNGVQPGLFNQNIGTFELAERSRPMFTVGTVISATITTAGVVWSHAIEAHSHASALDLANETSTLSADRKTATWTISTASAASTFGYINSHGPWQVDVAASAVLGAAVNVTVTAGSLLVIPSSVTIGYINNVISGSAATPVVYIGENDQSTGMVTIKEVATGYFTAGGTNNTLTVCLDSGDEFFTRAPFAVVTASDLKLRNPSTLLGTASQVGVIDSDSDFECATWTIYSASTDVPGTIEIRGSGTDGTVLPTGSLNGGRINVRSGSPIGTVNLSLNSGSATEQTEFDLVAIAVRAFRSGVVVTALSQPLIPAGSADSLGGNISISETLTGQFRSGQDICVQILPRASNHSIQDTFLKTANTNDRPVITVTGSGLVVGPVSIGCEFDFYDESDGGPDLTNSFGFTVQQQAFAPTLGVITISNIHFITVADAPSGAVLLSVRGNNHNSATAFQTIVSNARIGTAVVGAGTATTRLGVTQIGTFTTATKIAKLGKYVTYRFDFGVAAAGQAVKVWGATKTGNDWSAFTAVTTRTANASGVVYYSIRQASATWKSYRAMWTGGNAWTPARQARWVS